VSVEGAKEEEKEGLKKSSVGRKSRESVEGC